MVLSDEGTVAKHCQVKHFAYLHVFCNLLAECGRRALFCLSSWLLIAVGEGIVGSGDA
jgi:hypothetical protein